MEPHATPRALQTEGYRKRVIDRACNHSEQEAGKWRRVTIAYGRVLAERRTRNAQGLAGITLSCVVVRCDTSRSLQREKRLVMRARLIWPWEFQPSMRRRGQAREGWTRKVGAKETYPFNLTKVSTLPHF
jgi:hypothetical protein